MTTIAPTLLGLAPATLLPAFNAKPLQYTHNLSGLDLFRMDYLYGLAEKVQSQPRDFVASLSAPQPGTDFFALRGVPSPLPEAVASVDSGHYRILIKRAEDYDARFKELLHSLFDEVMATLGGLGKQKLLRLESGLFISSARSIAPFHVDPEVAFFSQIEGKKIYHVYSPQAVHESELERFSLAGPSNLFPLPLEDRDPGLEHVFHLDAGLGFHQPQNAPHWVETTDSRSISFTFVFETDVTRAVGYTRAFNYYLRRMNLSPSMPGAAPSVDVFKANAIQMLDPIRKAVAGLRR